MNFTYKNKIALILGSIMALSGCANSQIALDTTSHASLMKNDYAAIKDLQAIETQTLELSLEEALDRALQNNLDARVAAIELLASEDDVNLARLEAFPSLTASGNYIGRSNPGASSSLSVLTNTQSLEPSISTEQYRVTADLKASWNLMDIALAAIETKRRKQETNIAAEQYEKVIQNIYRDTYTAYSRALAYQKLKKDAYALSRGIETEISNIKSAVKDKLISAEVGAQRLNAFQQRAKTLDDLKTQLALADVELKSLLSLSQDTDLVLNDSNLFSEADIKRALEESVYAQEEKAILKRPEMRQEVLQYNIAIENTREEIIRTIPGAEIFGGFNRDTNRFLVDRTWVNFSANITQNLIDILTLPARHRAAKNKENVSHMRRVALMAAILTQVHISKRRLEIAYDIYQKTRNSHATFSELEKATRFGSDNGMKSKQDALIAKIDSKTEKLRTALARSALHDAYADMMNTLGKRIGQNPDIAMITNIKETSQ